MSSAGVQQLLMSGVLSFLLLLVCASSCIVGQNVETPDNWLLCRQCGHEVAQASDLIRSASSHALRQRNDTILGVPGILIQLLQNPNGNKFEVITARKADVYKYDKVVAEHSWFDGFSWRVAVCPRCGAHLGWSFEPHHHLGGKEDSEETFVGLVLGHLLHRDYADSLLMIPKAYRS